MITAMIASPGQKAIHGASPRSWRALALLSAVSGRQRKLPFAAF
jgi:hypothetical protein